MVPKKKGTAKLMSCIRRSTVVVLALYLSIILFFSVGIGAAQAIPAGTFWYFQNNGGKHAPPDCGAFGALQVTAPKSGTQNLQNNLGTSSVWCWQTQSKYGVSPSDGGLWLFHLTFSGNSYPTGTALTVTIFISPTSGHQGTQVGTASFNIKPSSTSPIEVSVPVTITTTGTYYIQFRLFAACSPSSGTLTVTQDATYVYAAFSQSTSVNDNTYGANAIGWPNGHKFSDLTGSDEANFVFTNGAGTTIFNFKVDYLTASSSFPSGYGSLGVTGGDGSITVGNPAHVSGIGGYFSSLDKNFNGFGYVLTTNSPATDANYTPNPTYPNWIFKDEYYVKVPLADFGPSGLGSVTVPFVHNSPSKASSCNLALTVGVTGTTLTPPITIPENTLYVIFFAPLIPLSLAFFMRRRNKLSRTAP